VSRSLERTIVDCIEHGNPLRPLLYPLSLLFQAGVILKNKAYDQGWLRAQKVSSQVISIGNLVAGGTGKTPFLMLLLKRVGRGTVLTRGYRTQDEPRMIVNHFPEIAMHIGKDRVKPALQAKGPIFLDDGMQYRKLHRDLEIVVLNGRDLFGKGYFLPRGFLRDSPLRLEKADYIVLNNCEAEAQFNEQVALIRKYSHAPVIGTRFLLKKSYKGQKVALFCGLGSPRNFFKAIEQAGGEIIETLILDDHVAPRREALQAFSLSAKEKGAEKLLCTEKDWVKLPSPLESPLDIECAYGEMEVIYGQNEFEALIRKIV
jgi:tetraacyldisaccharide 4'-kinase